MKELSIQKFIKSHSEWEKLLSEKPYGLHINKDNGYVIFKYDMINSNFKLPEVCEARGLILKENTWECVCHPFDKFFNYGETNAAEIDWESASVQEKIDGSMIKFWFDNNKWNISTNGTIDAFKANLESQMKFNSFGDLAIAAMPVSFDKFVEKMDKTHTYMFELVSPYNRVVIEYKTPKLYFIGERDNIIDQEIWPEQSEWFKSIHFEILLPKKYNLHNLAEVRKAAESLQWNEEGYVVCDKYFKRNKIKSPSYVKAHYCRNNNVITYERILSVILAGEEEEFLVYASDYKEELLLVKNSYESIKKQITNTITKIQPEKFNDKKSYAKVVLQEPRWIQPFLFSWNKLDELFNKIKERKWIEIMKQKGDLK